MRLPRHLTYLLIGSFIAASALYAQDVPATMGGAILGKGFDSHDQEYRGDCIKYDPAKVLYVGGSGAQLAFSRSLSQKELADSLGFSGEGRAQFGVVKTSLAAGFAKEATSDDYSETTVYQATYNFKNAYLNATDLQTFAQGLKGSGQFVPTAFSVSCGDKYVKQVKLGAALYFSVKVSFSTREQKDRFTSSFSIEGPFSGVSGNLDKASKEFGQDASIQISALQIGGRVDRLSTIFSDATAEQTPGGVHAILLCSMSNLRPCLQVITKALDYATNPTDVNAFPQQITPDYDPSRPGGPAELAYTLEPWSNIGLQVPPKVVGDVIEAQRNRLSTFLSEQLKYLTRLDDLKQRTFRLSPNQASTINLYSALVDQNMLGIATTATTCYTEDEKCPQAVITLSADIGERNKEAAFDPTKLDIQPETFAQWCDYTGYSIPTVVPPTPALKSSRTTVDALVKIARDTGVNTQDDAEWAKVGDKCGYSDKLLSQVQRVSLAGKNISDVRPLSELTSLRLLDLSKNNLGDEVIQEGKLSNLHGLLSLNVSGNSLQSTMPLTTLGDLRVLDISNNHVIDVKPLAVLTNLQVLQANGNPLTCKDAVKCCPLLRVDGVCKF